MIQRVNEAFVKEQNEPTALRALALRQAREIAALKERLQAAGNPIFASDRCNVCFRKGVHGVWMHDLDERAMKDLPDDVVGAIRAIAAGQPDTK